MSGSYVIRSELYNPDHPEYGVVTVPFPIPREEYDHILELMEPLEIGDPIRRDCRISEQDSFYTVLERMDSLVNLDELDYLAKRLDSFDDQEAAQFQAMAHKLHLTNMTDFINLTFCCQQVTVITDFSDLEKIGKNHYLTLMGGSCPKKDYDEVDGVETAYLLLERDDAVITPYGVVYDNGMKLESVYDGLHFPEHHHNPSLMTLSVRDEAGDGTTYLYLPAPDLQIERLLCRTGHSGNETRYTIQECNLPPQLHSGVERGDNTIQSLNHLCQTLMTLTEPQLNELSAVMEQAVSGSVHEELEMGGM